MVNFTGPAVTFLDFINHESRNRWHPRNWVHRFGRKCRFCDKLSNLTHLRSHCLTIRNNIRDRSRFHRGPKQNQHNSFHSSYLNARISTTGHGELICANNLFFHIFRFILQFKRIDWWDDFPKVLQGQRNRVRLCSLFDIFWDDLESMFDWRLLNFIWFVLILKL